MVVVDLRSVRKDLDQVTTATMSGLRSAYPFAVVRALPDSEFSQPALSGHVTVKLQVMAYTMGFGVDVSTGLAATGNGVAPMVLPQGKWNGVSALAVTVFDKRGTHDAKSATTVERVVSKANTWGRKSGHDALHESLGESVRSLVAFLNSTLTT